MNRYWLLTWTTYGTWLPGDQRGFVSKFQDEKGRLVIHNLPGTPYDADMPALKSEALKAMIGDPVYLNADQAQTIVEQFVETCGYRGWVDSWYRRMREPEG